MADLFNATQMSSAEKSEAWKRIRVGLAGLGGIVLMLAIFSAMLARLEQKDVAAPAKSVGGKPAPQTEPMAGLGVAPGAPEPTLNAK